MLLSDIDNININKREREKDDDDDDEDKKEEKKIKESNDDIKSYNLLNLKKTYLNDMIKLLKENIQTQKNFLHGFQRKYNYALYDINLLTEEQKNPNVDQTINYERYKVRESRIKIYTEHMNDCKRLVEETQKDINNLKKELKEKEEELKLLLNKD